MTNDDREGQIFLSRPHMDNGLFFLLTAKYSFYIGKHGKDFLAMPWVCLRFMIVEFPDHTHLLFLKKILITLRCDMVKLF